MMNKQLTLGSLFDGSGGFPLGGLLLGIKPLWLSEIEPFPIRVTSKRLPHVKHLGDISTINGAEIDPVDIITFGSPCQNMSIAGNRAGLDGEQSVLFYEAIRIIKEMRCKTNGQYPRYAVWENVPGAFSSNKGEDFKAVLEAIISVKEPNTKVPLPEKGQWAFADILLGDGWSVAYRTIDAQYFGVPQRRRRIFLVADFADRCAREILFEPEGMSRNFTKGFSPWQGTAGNIKNSTGEAIGGITCLNDQGSNVMSVSDDVTATLRAEEHGHQPCIVQPPGIIPKTVMSFEPGAVSRIGGHTDENLSGSLRANMGDNQTAVVIENHPTDGRVKISEDNTVQTLTSRMGTGGGNVPLLMDNQKTYDVRFTSEGTINTRANVYESDTSRTIDTGGNTPDSNQGGIVVVALQGSMIGRDDKNGPRGSGIDEDVSFTLNTVDRHGVVYALDRESFNCGKNYARNLGITEDGVASTLNAQGPSAVATPTYSSSKASFFTNVEKELANTLVATDYKDPPLINDMEGTQYTVRRLTPTECGRLQGFPDYWCSNLGTENPSEDEIEFFTEVWETHRKVIGKSNKPKTRKQIIKWLQNPHSDAAEYKMWGNGLALPCVCFVLQGIVLLSIEDKQKEEF